MSAIEYGTSYWAVVLNGTEPSVTGETVHLHADSVKVDPTGALIFNSVGRRPAGTWPEKLPQPGQKSAAAPAPSEGQGQHDSPAAKDPKAAKQDEGPGTVFVAFAPGTWKTVYAAKLQDGAPASIEHWTAFGGKPMLPTVVPPAAGAEDVPPPTAAPQKPN